MIFWKPESVPKAVGTTAQFVIRYRLPGVYPARKGKENNTGPSN